MSKEEVLKLTRIKIRELIDILEDDPGQAPLQIPALKELLQWIDHVRMPDLFLEPDSALSKLIKNSK